MVVRCSWWRWSVCGCWRCCGELLLLFQHTSVRIALQKELTLLCWPCVWWWLRGIRLDRCRPSTAGWSLDQAGTTDRRLSASSVAFAISIHCHFTTRAHAFSASVDVSDRRTRAQPIGNFTPRSPAQCSQSQSCQILQQILHHQQTHTLPLSSQDR